MRDENELKAVAQVCIDKVVEESPFKSCAHTSVYPETVAGEFYAARIVDKTERGAEINVVFGLKIKLSRLAEVIKRLIVLFSAGNNVRIRKVREGKHNGGVFRLNLLELLLLLLDLCSELFHLSENRGAVLPFFFIYGNEFCRLVLLGFEAFA